MKVERVKYVIWAKDMERCVEFYSTVFGADVIKKNDHIAELLIENAIIGIHRGGEGKRTWTGMSFQVTDVIIGAREIIGAGGKLNKEPEPEDNEPPHLAMFEDTEGNQIMLTRDRS